MKCGRCNPANKLTFESYASYLISFVYRSEDIIFYTLNIISQLSSCVTALICSCVAMYVDSYAVLWSDAGYSIYRTILA